MTGWDPDRYGTFAAERAEPFHDLRRLVAPVPGGMVWDLGCGTGELTAELHRHAGAALTVGVDNSSSMLARAATGGWEGVVFVQGDLGRPPLAGTPAVVFANASLHWVPAHAAVLSRLAGRLGPGGQLAVQVPANSDHPSHLVAARVAAEEPFLSALGGLPPADPVAANVLAPEEYAALLYRLGFTDRHVRLQVYGHVLPDTEAVVDWVSGSSLTRFRRQLDDDVYAAFLERYRRSLLAELGESRPYFFPFKRILLWGRLGGR